MPDKKPDLSGCAICEDGNHGECVNAMCDCSCRTEGPWNWLRSKLSVEDFQRLSYQHGCVVIRVRKEARREALNKARAMLLAMAISVETERWSDETANFDDAVKASDINATINTLLEAE